MLGLFLTCFMALALATVLLIAFGHTLHRSSVVSGVVLTAGIAVGGGWIASHVWSLRSRDVVVGEVMIAMLGVFVVSVRRVWNPLGQVFFAAFLGSAISYLWFGAATMLASGLSGVGRVASFVLWLFEFVALALSTSFTFESCDTICRAQTTRPEPRYDPEYRPMVSLQIAAYNEPPDMLMETIASLEAIDYPDFEIIVIDNNTKDPAVWQPVEEYCRDRERVQFVHVDPWPGFKAGALNLVLEKYTDPRTEIVGIVDADYMIDPSWLRSLVGFFVDPNLAFVQSPQDYREYERDAYLKSCYDAYKYFFAVTMPSRNQRNSIIFAGTMGLMRRSTLAEVGGFDEWCITEDAELSLRMLKAGYSGHFVPESYGYGIMPLTFSALKSQRFRWCFGGMQILRMHWRDLLPWRRDPKNNLTTAQRVDYAVGNLQWMNDLVYFFFTVALLTSALVLLHKGVSGLRPLYGAAVLLPSALIVSGLVRALWALRVNTGIGWKRAFLAFFNWLSLSWTVAISCVQGLTRRKGVFLRTPKEEERNRLLAALWSARTESLWALALWTLAVTIVLRGRATPFLIVLLGWQGAVYASAPFMSWLNQHIVLSAQLERRRRTEAQRERSNLIAPIGAGILAIVAATSAVALIIGLGGSNPGKPTNPFALPRERNKSPTQQTTPATSATTANTRPATTVARHTTTTVAGTSESTTPTTETATTATPTTVTSTTATPTTVGPTTVAPTTLTPTTTVPTTTVP